MKNIALVSLALHLLPFSQETFNKYLLIKQINKSSKLTDTLGD